ncbi:primosomal protein DnaI [Peribacillus cavernae]|uniref:Primosomal protein DnaI n=1 Tax=Peribacillus cavernae TaxID=1674310 RepID=A0A433HAQ0_9BACI|nr:primosomal protein DnaI [Peribacillus cavernae]MDQ0220099.1 primosomal protein DnaI [Peribacillus cavernae]RUQ25461.1 primosomal protein DnaI [Peribacillus cavernae]
MQRISDALNKLANNIQFQHRYEHVKNEVLNDEEIQLFLHENSSRITSEMIEKSLSKLYEFSSQSKNCGKCPNLDGCINMMEGYHPKLLVQGNTIDLHYEICPRKSIYDEKRKHERLIQSLYVPKDILSASLGDFYQTDTAGGRIEAIEKATTFVEEYAPGKKQKGLYLHGSFGVGKTYLLGAIANELAENQISSLIVYVPDFLREIKASIGDNTINDKIEMTKKAPVLMLDDFGAETMSSWTRDEVIGPILQFRMLENLPTFFTSNFDFGGLQNHLTFSQRGEKEEVKAARIMERIQYLAEPLQLTGENRRR